MATPEHEDMNFKLTHVGLKAVYDVLGTPKRDRPDPNAECAFCWHPRWDHGPDGCQWEGMADINFQACGCLGFVEADAA